MLSSKFVPSITFILSHWYPLTIPALPALLLLGFRPLRFPPIRTYSSTLHYFFASLPPMTLEPPRVDATVGVLTYLLTSALSGGFYLIQITTCEICESTSGLLFLCARDIPNEFADGNALTHVFGHVESLGTPGRDKILPEKCTSTIALLHYI